MNFDDLLDKLLPELEGKTAKEVINYLVEQLDLSRGEARRVVRQWLRTFGE